MKKKIDIKSIILLEVAFFIYSICSMILKSVSYTNELSKIIIAYLLGVFVLGIYAILWQQVLKRMNLSIAFANKVITILWGMIWGKLIFNENINIGMIIGAIVVIIGIVIMMKFGEEEK